MQIGHGLLLGKARLRIAARPIENVGTDMPIQPSDKFRAGLCAGALCVGAMASSAALSEPVTTPIPPPITTPASVETSIGNLQFPKGVPSAGTAQKDDQLDLQRGVSAFLNGLRGVSIFAARKGIRDAGVADNDVLIFSG